MDKHMGCILAIVGSRDVPVEGAMRLIGDALDFHQPLLVLSGGAQLRRSDLGKGLVSIDAAAVAEARVRGITATEIKPEHMSWLGVPGKKGFKQRNEQIAEGCMCLVRIASETTKTFGSGWTANYAETLGKDVQRWTVMSDGRIVEGDIPHE